ncbi:HNH endonuclease [Clostridium botulinum]|uniref:HNH endonuclease n=1 Tax=Clostridium botulinum TaxID=1491 RepID=A0A6M0SR30_CLOBO|nr:HNH endonuclease [Clostridium botulinum]NFO35134.1 HNH endonuclease [Clostridium botulinum]NFO48388.1 HNH endonuclease [Clostridium botulinum]
MLISCAKCGKIHDRKFKCNVPRAYKKRGSTLADRFRNTQAWRDKKKGIKDRDKHLCQICIRNLYSTHGRIYNAKVEVHHIVPLNEDYQLRLTGSNLICLCPYHHKLAERGHIQRSELKKIVESNTTFKEQSF